MSTAQSIMENTSKTLASTLQGHAELSPDSPFVVHLATNESVTYQQAWESASKICVFLSQHKIGKKGRIVLLAKNHWVTYPLLVACNMRQATLIPLDPDLHRDQLSGILKEAAPSLTIYDEGISVPKLPGNNNTISLPELISALEPIQPNSKSRRDMDEKAAAAIVLMIYTSGTTGNSKAVMLTASNLLANAAALAERYQVTQQDRFFCTLPTYHMNALMMTGMVPMVAGASIFLSEILSFKNAKLFWKRLAEHEITICSLVPSIMALLLKLFPRGAKTEIPKLRFGFCGAAPLSAETWQQFEDAFSFPIYQGYGLTETTCWAVSTPMDGARQYDTVGVPLPRACEVKIDAGKATQTEVFLFEQEQKPEAEVPVTGEVLISGAIVSPGYYKNKKLTKRLTTPDGFYKTGDLGYFDHNGYLRITGRIKDIIIKNGANVPSADVDQFMMQHPSVKECKTIGMPDKLVGERIYVACVIDQEQPVTDQLLRSWAHDHLSHHMWPDAVELLGYLPRGAAGKVSVNLLRKIITGELTDEILASLSSWKFKRAQASGVERMRDNLQACLRQGTPIQFLTYWGCGSRSSFSKHDLQSLERLQEYMNSARRTPQTAPKMTLIFTDVHAQNNRIPKDRMEQYFAGIQEHATKVGMDTILLSEIWQDGGLSPELLAEKLKQEAFETTWQGLEFKDHLIEQAGKHLEQSNDPESAARFYYMACTHESVVIAERYPTSIFTTYNHPDFDFLLPPLPKVYLHSYKEGTSVKPWFVD